MEDEGDDKDDTKRRTRNLSEKKRRDQFNMLVNELSSMISTNNRKMDKSTVLKSTISFLKNHNEVTVRSRAHDIQEDWKPSFLSNEEFTYLVLEALEGFVMVFSGGGKIYYVSEGIMSLLGHNPADVVNKSIFDLAYEEDRPNIYNILNNPGMIADPLQTVLKENEVRFQCHLRRGTLDFREEVTYEQIQFNGYFRMNTEDVENPDVPGYTRDPDSRLLFICTGRLYTQLIRDVSLVDSNRSEFTSRHSLEWKFLFLDHRAPPIIGYLPFEVLGTSGYDYYHFDDLEKVITCHEALMQKGELTSCYYRFLTKGQQWIWLQSRFYITYHQWNSKPEFVVCTHRVVNYSDVSNGIKSGGEEEEMPVVEEDPDPEPALDTSSVKEPPAEDTMPAMPVSPPYMPESSENYGNTYPPLSRPQSVKSASASSTAGTVVTIGTAATASASWPRATNRFYGGSDTASMSSGSSQRNSIRQMKAYAVERQCEEMRPNVVVCQAPYPRIDAPPAGLLPQHGVGAQYLEPTAYVDAASAVGVAGMIPLPLAPRPIIVSPEHAQLQEQLQRKHEALQQMIVRQQEELRQVKEQLLLARLGILQPLINQVQNPYISSEDLQPRQQLSGHVAYEASPVIQNYPAQPPHPTGHHQHMPQ